MHGYNLDSIKAHLPGDFPWADRILFFDSLDSTNNLAKEMAASAPHNGTVIIADQQTGGRGRLGRSFTSPPASGIYLTVILKLDCSPEKIMHLTCAAAVAAVQAVWKATGILPSIKWTNDLVVDRKKIAGILTELMLAPESGLVRYAIIGIGINCCQDTADFPPALRDKAASLRMVTGQIPDRSLLAAELIRAIKEMADSLLAQPDMTLRFYREHCVTLGEQVSVVQGEEVFHALALSVDEKGGLIVELEDGSIQTVTSGEVSIRGMYGYV